MEIPKIYEEAIKYLPKDNQKQIRNTLCSITLWYEIVNFKEWLAEGKIPSRMQKQSTYNILSLAKKINKNKSNTQEETIDNFERAVYELECTCATS